MIGTFVISDGVVCTEILSKKLDFLIFDREHGLNSFETIRNQINTASKNCKTYIRVSKLDYAEIQRATEAKPDGIVVPQISSIEDAKKAIAYTFYKPKGNKGLSPYTKAFDYNHQELSKKIRNYNKNTQLVLLIEGEEGLKNLEGIVQTCGKDIDVIYLGLYDFSQATGVEPDWKNEKIKRSLKVFKKHLDASDIKFGSIARDEQEIKLLKKYGSRFTVYLNDTGIISQSIP